ncbi:MAG: hypothetical protein M0T76_11085 [Desulfobacteraceae bacterium]|nr:hypothetical protein [Desulfobacteraceae bacterium]
MSQESPSVAEKPVSEEAILKTAKEVAIKFIEVGRLTPGNFTETFRELYAGIKATVRER